MAIRANVTYKNRSGSLDSRALGPNQALVIGSSTMSDLQLPSDHDVLGRHCRIRLTNEKCIIEDLTRGKGKLMANGQAFSSLDLQGRTKIQIGLVEVEVLVSGQSVNSSATSESTPSSTGKAGSKSAKAATVSKPVPSQRRPIDDPPDESSEVAEPALPEYQHELLQGILHCFAFPDDEDGMRFVSGRLKGKGCFELVNFEAIGESAEQHGETDLLAELLEDDEDDSFTVRGPFPFEDFPSALIDSKQNDNLMLAITKDADAPERDEFISKIKLYMAWLLRPSRFFFSVENGQKQLLNGIFEQVYSILFYSVEKRAWLLLSLDESVVTTAGDQ